MGMSQKDGCGEEAEGGGGGDEGVTRSGGVGEGGRMGWGLGLRDVI